MSVFKFVKFCHAATVANVNHYVDVCLAVIKMFAISVDAYMIVRFLIVLMDLMEIVIAVEIAICFKRVIVMDVIAMGVIVMDVI